MAVETKRKTFLIDRSLIRSGVALCLSFLILLHKPLVMALKKARNDNGR